MFTDTRDLLTRAFNLRLELSKTIPALEDLVYPTHDVDPGQPSVRVSIDKRKAPIDLDSLDEYLAVIKELERLIDIANRSLGTPHPPGNFQDHLAGLPYKILDCIRSARLPLAIYLVQSVENLRDRVRSYLGFTRRCEETGYACPECWEGNLVQYWPEEPRTEIQRLLPGYQPVTSHTVRCEKCLRVWLPAEFLELGRRLRSADSLQALTEPHTGPEAPLSLDTAA